MFEVTKNKEKRIFVRVTQSEHEVIKQLSDKKGMTISDIIRELIGKEVVQMSNGQKVTA